MLFSLHALAATVAFVGVSYGATCESGSQIACTIADGAIGRESDFYAARQAYCGSDKWKTTSCYKHKTNTVPIFIQNSKPGANSQQVCWDATENIIQQCYRREVFGYYDYNGQRYRVGACSNGFVC